MEPERARGEAAADSEGGRSSCAEEEQNVLQELSELPVEGAGKRPTCSRCSRPQKVCLCPFLPVHPLNVSTCLYIVQHPAEESRVLRTVPLLAACLPADKCKVFIGRRFNEDRHPELAAVCQSISTLVLYPGPEANNLEELELDPSLSPYNIIIIDGTWSQAKTMFYGNALFRLPKQVQLKTSLSSQYIIRTQPNNTCLSTLECAAFALSIVEKDHYIHEVILRPLQALCSFQLQHGAQVHHNSRLLRMKHEKCRKKLYLARKILPMLEIQSNPYKMLEELCRSDNIYGEE
ncbi:tRNA-uridine aminocarboxypropyltransferase 2 isoform X1 [Hypanus sabinus]|uniref:tRNA-uridine aminocarboxypropyltransferase 2 isoform X1 n=1 Tax=Hypanus sabinus TaxID=79690 RepID=UPI0028C4340C|nr:tRNA-uridine aminocarboxypropyltransferase 2 isoform X1 [Hypanus sabinus]